MVTAPRGFRVFRGPDGAVLSELTPVRSTLEDVFVDLVRAEEGVSVGAHS